MLLIETTCAILKNENRKGVREYAQMSISIIFTGEKFNKRGRDE